MRASPFPRPYGPGRSGPREPTATRQGLQPAQRLPGYEVVFLGSRQGLTCLSLSCSILARRFLSGGDRYFCVSNFFSSSMVWSLEKRTCPPFLLCRGRWMKGLHSSGFPSKRGTAPNATGRLRTRVPGESWPEPGSGDAPGPGPADFLHLL